jgi:hypothetical protein
VETAATVKAAAAVKSTSAETAVSASLVDASESALSAAEAPVTHVATRTGLAEVLRHHAIRTANVGLTCATLAEIPGRHPACSPAMLSDAVEHLLSLADRRPRGHARTGRPVVKRYAPTVSRVVDPGVAPSGIHAVKAIIVDEGPIDNDSVLPPSGIPSPTAPAAAP